MKEFNNVKLSHHEIQDIIVNYYIHYNPHLKIIQVIILDAL